MSQVLASSVVLLSLALMATEAGAATITNNLWGNMSLVTFDSDFNCTSANCNPGGGQIGYRKPSGVSW